MANSITIKVEGLHELGVALAKLDSDMANRIAWEATGSAAGVVKTHAQSNIRSSPSVRTGRLLKSVIAKRLPKNQAEFTAEHIVTVRGRGGRSRTLGASHAHFVEFGTVHMPAEPFLGPALSSHVEEAIAAMKRALERGIAGAGR